MEPLILWDIKIFSVHLVVASVNNQVLNAQALSKMFSSNGTRENTACRTYPVSFFSLKPLKLI